MDAASTKVFGIGSRARFDDLRFRASFDAGRNRVALSE
jgi:hypothetical protein